MSTPEHINNVYQRATCIFNRTQVEHAIDELAQQIHTVLSEQNPLLLCIMIGGVVLTGHLLPRLDFPLTVDYCHATRYRGKTLGEEIVWKSSPNTSLKDRTILIVEDILDQGVTLQAVCDYCQQQGAKAIYTAVLLDKTTCRLPEGLPKADFTALSIADGYVFGYGLDYHDYLRNAPGIFKADIGDC